MNLTEVSALLQREIGLSLDSIGSSALQVAIDTRMAARRCPTLAAYGLLLLDGSDELAELIEEMVVPETWFFRGTEQFRFLARHAAERIRQRPTGSLFRVLSIPCSTGEEPYSLAIVLVQAGLPLSRLQIDAVDISRRALAHARRGVYSQSSFREKGPEWLLLREQFFVPAKGEWDLLENIRAAIRLRSGNLARADFLATEPPYDVIFCRNLLIYLDAPAREKAVGALHRLVSPSGLVFMGHAEPLSLWDTRFQRVGPDQGFAFTRVAPKSQPRSAARTSSESPRSDPTETRRTAATTKGQPIASGPGRSKRGHVSQPLPVHAEVSRAESPPAVAMLLDRAEALANAGRLEAAQAACDEHLQKCGPTARAFYLLGLIRQATGNAAEAEQCFLRVLYLEPKDRDALMHLLLLADARGDERGAANYRRRLQQLDEA